MTTNRTTYPCSLFGIIAVRLAGALSGCRQGRDTHVSRSAAGVRPVAADVMRCLVTALLLLLLVPIQTPCATNGDKIVNRATFHSSELPDIPSSVIITVTQRTTSTLEFLKYAPGVSGASPYTVPETYHRESTGAFTKIPAPCPFGSQIPIDLNSPVPLLATTLFHSEEPIFVKTVDSDQNIDRTVAETIIITITDPKTGDREILRLSETGPDTGIFIGYIPTETAKVNNPPNGANGTLSVDVSSSITANYIDIYDGSDNSVDAALVDPYGIVFDTMTGMPVDGATIELIDEATGLGAVVFGDNGLSSNLYPNQIVTGGVANDAEGNTYSFPPGGYRFPYVAPGNYILRVTPPDTHTAPSSVSTARIQTLPGAPFAILEPGSRGEVFTVPAGPAIRVDIPIDPKIGTLWLRKSAGKAAVSAGEFLSYEITLENNDPVGTLFSTVVTDRLPPGFRYQKGSTRINDRAAADPLLSADGRTMTFTAGTIAPSSSLTIRYVVSIGAGSKPGTAINTATAATTPAVAVKEATASVLVQDPFMMSRSIIMGRVVVGACSDNPDDSRKGMEGIGIYLEDGTFVFSDAFGMFHFEGVRPGVHVVQLDLDSIPDGYRILPCEQNSRFAGRAYSQFVDMQGGTMWRTDFYLGRTELAPPPDEKSVEQALAIAKASEAEAPPAPVATQVAAAPADRFIVTPFTGEISLEMLSSRNEEIIDYRLPLQAHTVPLRKLRMSVVLPEGAHYIPGSSSFNGSPLPDPEITADGLLYPLEDSTDKWRRELQFRAVVDKNRKAGDLVTRATLRFDTEIASNIVTPEVTNILAITKEEKIIPLPLFVFRPHFPTFGDALSDEDRKELDALVASLKDKIVRRIDVTGHTDNVRIAPRSRKIHADNRALSLARAKSVGRYLSAALSLPPEALYLNGSGENEPIATNRTAAGRALNRRVEVRVTAMQRIETTELKIIKERSGLEKRETNGAPVIEKIEEPVTLKPLQLRETEVSQQAAEHMSESGNAAMNGGPQAVPQTVTPTQASDGQKISVAPPAGTEERIELSSIISDGIVHYRMKLKGAKQPPGKVAVTLTMPKSLLYMNGSSRTSDAPAPDPVVEESTLLYDFARLDDRKKFELRLQALFDGDDKSDDAVSKVNLIMTDDSGSVVKTLTATSTLSDNAEELSRPDSDADTVVQPAETAQTAATDDRELYQEKPAMLPQPARSDTAATDPVLHVLEEEGILSHSDGGVIATRINSVRAVLSTALKPLLLVDGKEIPAERIGFSMKDSKSGKSLYTYIGVDFGEAGEHTVQLQGIDTFGVARFDRAITITRTGEIAEIRLVSAEGNIADGKTPVRVRIQLVDIYGKSVAAAAELAVKGGDLMPLSSGSFMRESIRNIASVNADGWIEFKPVNASGLYRLQLAYNKATLDLETYIKPKMRDWILVGIAEGTAGYNTLSGNMEALKSSDADDNFYDRGRLALYAKGTIKGEWLLTMAYDSDKKSTGVSGNALFQTIDPNSYYTLYGDATAQGYDAASQRKLYLKIERNQFYALFGDYDTGLTVSELSRYSRRMNGIKSEYRSTNFDMTAFGSETGQAFVKDEIRGDGTSGLYRLSRSGIVINSEKITIESRDRFHSEIVTNSQQMNRFVDYSIDYDNGTIFFKSPIASRDEQLNPVYIVVDYEIADAGNDALTYGGRIGTTQLDGRLRAGATYTHEGQVSGESNLYGIDATMNLNPETRARAEVATTNTDLGSTRTSGNAYLAEVVHTGRKLEGRGYYREQEEDFGIGQQKGSETATRKFGVEGLYRIDQQISVGGQAYRQYNLANGAVRDFIEGGGIYTDKLYSTKAGLRYTNDSLADGSNATSVQGTFGGHWKTKDQRFTLRADHEQSLYDNNENSDYPTRTILGADYQATAATILFAQQELTYGEASETFTTRAGIKSTPWSGGSVTTSMVNDMKENSERTFANVGLAQKWQMSPRWAVDAGLDHNQTIRRKNGYIFNSNVPPASGGEDFTALSLGANYTEKKVLWSNRVEFRNSDTTDKWGILSGFVNEQGNNWGWTTRLQLLHSQSPGSISRSDAELRFGLAYRPPVTNWIVLDRLDTIYTEDTNASATSKSRRIVNNLNVNYKPDRKTQYSFQYGAKYVLETVDDHDYSGYTDLIGFEMRHDVTPKLDIGVRCASLHSWELNQFSYAAAPTIGYNVMENAWINLGYNIVGFEDQDFSKSSFTAQGPFVQFRFKFDQNSLKDGLKALNN